MRAELIGEALVKSNRIPDSMEDMLPLVADNSKAMVAPNSMAIRLRRAACPRRTFAG